MYLYFGTRLEESVAATMILISVIEAWGIFFNLVTKVKPIRKLEIYLQEIVDKGKYCLQIVIEPHFGRLIS